jgi:hypothetical protein
MSPTIGRIVIYNFSPEEARAVNNSSAKAAAVITAVWSDTCVNLKVLTDGPSDIWKTSRVLGDGPDSWAWPVIVK